MHATDKKEKTIESIEMEELRGVSRSVGEIQWLLMVVVLMYHVFGGTPDEDRSAFVVAMVSYALLIMGFRYANFFKNESRWKLAVETWVMTAFITWVLMHTGRLDSPLVNSYLLVIITSALTLGKASTLLGLGLIGACLLYLGDHTHVEQVFSLKVVAALFAQLAPFVLVAYITTMFASDIRYGLNKAKMLSETDELTQLTNRRGFAIIADRLFGQAQRYKRPISVLSIDCDNLKTVNDRLGHKAGDDLLVALAHKMQENIRHSDVLARLGGDEFVVLLPETSASGAVEAAEKVRAAAASITLALNGELVRTSVSVGLAIFPEDGTALDRLLNRADASMYRAKQAGRNCIDPLYTAAGPSTRPATADQPPPVHVDPPVSRS